MGVGVVDPRADDVGREQVGGELQPGERAVQRLCQRLYRQGLGQPRHTLEQHVAVGNQGQQQSVDQFLLAGDDPPHFGLDELERRRLDPNLFLKKLNVFLFHDGTSSKKIV